MELHSPGVLKGVVTYFHPIFQVISEPFPHKLSSG